MVAGLSANREIVALLSDASHRILLNLWDGRRAFRMTRRHQVFIRWPWRSIALIGLTFCTLWLMPGVKVQVVHGQDTSVEKGKGLYQRLCLACHGKAGGGKGYALFDPPPADLKSPATQGKTDEVLLETIRNGHPNTAMGTWKYALKEEEMRDVLMYIRTLAKDP